MKVSPIYATVAAAILMFGTMNAVRAEDGGKGGSSNNGSNSGSNNSGNAAQVRLRTNLAGGRLGGRAPEGHAGFRSEQGQLRLNVEVENVNLPDGTVLTVSVQHGGAITAVGTITLNSASNENELELESQHGDAVPSIVAGDMVSVANAGSVILAGAFQ